MNDNAFYEWLTSTTPSQFFIGVLILVFGSRQILSEKTLSSSLSGLLILPRFINRKREQAAQLEAQQTLDLQRTEQRQHCYILYCHKLHRELEMLAAAEGCAIPRLMTFQEWVEEQEDAEGTE